MARPDKLLKTVIEEELSFEVCLSRIEEKLGLDRYKWSWCCDDFKEFCERTNKTTDKANYTEKGTYRRIFIFSGMLFEQCPFCGEIF